MGVEVYHHLKAVMKERYGKHAINVGDEGDFVIKESKESLGGLDLVRDAIAAAGYVGKVFVGVGLAASECKQDDEDDIFKEELNHWIMEEASRSESRIVSIQDPFPYSQWADCVRFTEENGYEVQIVGDDLLVTKKRLAKAIKERACNAFLHNVNQIGSVTESIEAVKMSKKAGFAVITSQGSGETEDTFIADLSVGLATFIEVGYELGSNYSELIEPQDVGLYGGLCALASFDRTELKTKVIDNVGFWNFLELVPEVRELINDFYASRYASCLGYFEKLKANLLLDIHLHGHVEELYTEIRHEAIIQYTLPFISVELSTMADAFETSVGGLEKELEALITNGRIQARIDSHKKVLYARHVDQRKTTFQRVLQTGGDFEREVKSMLLRANLVKHEVGAKSGRKF